MILSQATASGKVILFGEHAVVYQRPALAAPVTQVKAMATLQTNEATDDFTIFAPDLNQHYRLQDVDQTNPIAVIIHATFQHLSQPIPPSVQLKISSNIPLGRGLGSGAAVSAAIARAIANVCKHQLPPHALSSLVYQVERLHHGTPSGIDNTVIAFEQPVYFIKHQPLRRLNVQRPFHLVIADTGVVAPTHQAVSGVRHRWQANRHRYETCFDQIGRLTEKARDIIEQEQADDALLGQLMDENQTILETIGVSSPDLQRLIGVARVNGALGAKLSGAGHGGTMIALAASQTAATDIADALSGAGAVGVITTIIN